MQRRFNYGGENKNDLFYVCSLIEYIARTTKNTKENIEKMYELAQIYHCENIDKVANVFIQKCNILQGNYDIISTTNDSIPTYFDIGKVYARLIVMINDNEKEYIQTLMEVLTSWIIYKIDNYNSSMYYENLGYIYQCYLEGKVI